MMFGWFEELSLEELENWRNFMIIIILIDVFGVWWYLDAKKIGMALMIAVSAFLALVLIYERRQLNKMGKKHKKEEEEEEEYEEDEDDEEEEEDEEDEDDEEEEKPVRKKKKIKKSKKKLKKKKKLRSREASSDDSGFGFGLPDSDSFNRRAEKALGGDQFRF